MENVCYRGKRHSRPDTEKPQRSQKLGKYKREVIVLGKTGNGKSSTCNSLINREMFKVGYGLEAETSKCEIGHSQSATVVDTPGLFQADTPNLGKLGKEIHSSLDLCPKPHAFLILFNAESRLTAEDTHTLALLRLIFGDELEQHAIVVFTHGKKFETQDELKSFYLKSEKMTEIVNSFGERAISIDNEDVNAETIRTVFEAIDTVSKNGELRFKFKHRDIYRETLEQQIQAYEDDQSYKDQVDAMLETLKKLSDEHHNKCVAGCAVGSGVGLGCLLAAVIVPAAAPFAAVGVKALAGTALGVGSVSGGAGAFYAFNKQ